MRLVTFSDANGMRIGVHDSSSNTIVDLAIGWNVGQLKVGSFARGERMVKWNHALRIEEQLGAQARFAGGSVFRKEAAAMR